MLCKSCTAATSEPPAAAIIDAFSPAAYSTAGSPGRGEGGSSPGGRRGPAFGGGGGGGFFCDFLPALFLAAATSLFFATTLRSIFKKGLLKKGPMWDPGMMKNQSLP